MISLLIHQMSVLQKVKRYRESEKTRILCQFKNIGGGIENQSRHTVQRVQLQRTKHHPSPHQNCMWRIESFLLVLVGISFMSSLLVGKWKTAHQFLAIRTLSVRWLQIFYRIREEKKILTKLLRVVGIYACAPLICDTNLH